MHVPVKHTPRPVTFYDTDVRSSVAPCPYRQTKIRINFFGQRSLLSNRRSAFRYVPKEGNMISPALPRRLQQVYDVGRKGTHP